MTCPTRTSPRTSLKGSKSTEDLSVTADQPIGGFAKSVNGTSHVMCNEAPFDADRAKFRETALTNFKSSVLSN